MTLDFDSNPNYSTRLNSKSYAAAPGVEQHAVGELGGHGAELRLRRLQHAAGVCLAAPRGQHSPACALARVALHQSHVALLLPAAPLKQYSASIPYCKCTISWNRQ